MMPIIPLLFIAFLTVPIIEIYLLLQIGSIVGVIPTIMLVVFTAILGATLVRFQGLSTFIKIQQNLQIGRIPTYEMLDAMALLVAGALLLTPGFFTDSLGFLLLVPLFRHWLWGYALRFIQPMVVNSVKQSDRGPSQPDVIEGEFRHHDDN